MNQPIEHPKHVWSHTILTSVLSLLCILAGTMGMYAHGLTLVIALLLLWGIIARLIGLARKSNMLELLRNPLAKHLKWYQVQLALHILFVIAWVLAAKQNIDLVYFIDPAAVSTVWWVVSGLGLLFVLLAIVPRKQISASANIGLLLGTLCTFALWGQTFTGTHTNSIQLHSPFQGKSVVFQGGDAFLLNHHYLLQRQRYAVDMVKLSDGLVAKKNPSTLQDYVSFGAPLYAPASGKIVQVMDSAKDQLMGTTNAKEPVGNHVVIAMSGGKYILLAHLKKGSAKVKKGDIVKAGQLIAECGNSGNTTMPHLHLQVQNHISFHAKGVKTYPFVFKKARVYRYQQKLALPYSLRRGDVVESQKSTSKKSPKQS